MLSKFLWTLCLLYVFCSHVKIIPCMLIRGQESCSLDWSVVSMRMSVWSVRRQWQEEREVRESDWPWELSMSLSFAHEIMCRILFSGFNKGVMASKRKSQDLNLILIPELHLLIIKMSLELRTREHMNILWLKNNC